MKKSLRHLRHLVKIWRKKTCYSLLKKSKLKKSYTLHNGTLYEMCKNENFDSFY